MAKEAFPGGTASQTVAKITSDLRQCYEESVIGILNARHGTRREHGHFSWHALAPGTPYFHPPSPLRNRWPRREKYIRPLSRRRWRRLVSALNFLADGRGTFTSERPLRLFLASIVLKYFHCVPFKHGSFNHFIPPPSSTSPLYPRLTLKYLTFTRPEIAGASLSPRVVSRFARKNHSSDVPALCLYIYIYLLYTLGAFVNKCSPPIRYVLSRVLCLSLIGERWVLFIAKWTTHRSADIII